MARILVIDDDASRHADIEAWCARAGLELDLAASPPASPDGAERVDAIAIHAGYGRGRDGFPRARRAVEALHWFFDDPSYLFHEDLEAFRALGRASGTGVPLVILTGGSHRDLPVEEMERLAGGRRVVLWNVMDLLSTASLDEILAGPAASGRAVDPERLKSEIRHDLLNRLWNLALAAAEASPDPGEIAAIVRGEEDQSGLEVLAARAPGLGGSLRGEIVPALERAGRGEAVEGLAGLARAAIKEIESA